MYLNLVLNVYDPEEKSLETLKDWLIFLKDSCEDIGMPQTESPYHQKFQFRDCLATLDVSTGIELAEDII
jgi:hypothetical protein